MSSLRLAPGLGMPRMAVAFVMVMLLLGSLPLQAQAQAPSAAAHIQTYYQELMPTIGQAARLTVRERDKRFAPAITGAFDLATMTRLAVGPAWKNFSPAQQTAVQEAFTQFIVADYASRIRRLFGGKLRCRSADKSDIAWRRRNRQNQATAARRAGSKHKLSGPRRAGDRCLSQRDHQ